MYISFNLDEHSWDHDAVTRGIIPEYRGGEYRHGVSLVGYQGVPGHRWFLVHNSWGSDWGNGGYAWISENGLREHINHARIADVYGRTAMAPE